MPSKWLKNNKKMRQCFGEDIKNSKNTFFFFLVIRKNNYKIIYCSTNIRWDVQKALDCKYIFRLTRSFLYGTNKQESIHSHNEKVKEFLKIILRLLLFSKLTTENWSKCLKKFNFSHWMNRSQHFNKFL